MLLKSDRGNKTRTRAVMTNKTEQFVGEEIEGKYKILRFSKVGELANIYHGKEIATDRSVMIKLLNVGNFCEVKLNDYFDRFQKITEKISQLNHPNIVPVECFGVENEVPYLVLPEQSGYSLKQIVNEYGALSPSRIGAIVKQLASALDTARELDIVHGDLTPENITLQFSEDGKETVELHNLGMVKIVGGVEDADSRLTQHGDSLGTPEYLAPEQVQNLPITHATDMYALGIIAYEMFVGRPPFMAPMRIPLMLKHVTEIAPSFAELNPGVRVSNEVEDLIFEALEKNPSNRPESVLSFADRLCSALTKEGHAPRAAVRSSAQSAARTPHYSTGRAITLVSSAGLLVVLAVAAHARWGYTGNANETRAKLASSSALAVAEASIEDSSGILSEKLDKLEKLVSEGQFQEAVTIGDEVLELNFADAFTHYLLGRGYFGLQNEQKAMEHFRHARMLEPESALYRITLDRLESKLQGPENTPRRLKLKDKRQPETTETSGS